MNIARISKRLYRWMSDPFLLLSGSSRSLAARGWEHFNECEYRTALVLFNRALKRKPVDLRAALGRGVCWAETGRPKDAVRLLRWYVSHYPASFHAQHWLGVAYTRLDRCQEAIEPLQVAVRIEPKEAASHFTLGWALGNLRRDEEALSHFAQAARLDPDTGEYVLREGQAYFNLRRFIEAEKSLRAALALGSRAAEVNALLGSALVELGRFEEGIGVLERALRQPGAEVEDSQMAMLNLGVARGRQGEWEKALDHYTRARSLWPEHGPSHAYAVEALVALGRWKEAKEAFDRAESLDPGFIEKDADLRAARDRLLRALEGSGSESVRATVTGAGDEPPAP